MSYPDLLSFAAGLLVTGALSGVLAGLLGIGGGGIIVPALALALAAMGYGGDVGQHVAVATSLAIIIPIGLSSARAHDAKGALDRPTFRLWAPVIFVATLAGGISAGLFPGKVLQAVLGFMAFFIAANILLPFLERLMRRVHGSATAQRLCAAVIGYLCALMGTGGGALSVPTLAAFGLPIHTAVGTGAALGVPIALAGTLGFLISGWNAEGLPPLSLGYINLPALVLIGGVASLTAPFGARLAHRLPARTLKKVFAVFLVVVGVSMLWAAFG
ncbi:sulfite exporter TauE/SafE family protein [Bosea sp. TWI1241]|uniref:sulfite exporter TauE/SafE family protein n=1 Tax=Bosea sp. TWI1241 TaxID=3148904 RepID=UPI00320B0CB0